MDLVKLQSLSTLAGDIVHDFNNIPGTVLGNVSLAGTNILPANSTYDRLFDAEKAILRASNLMK